MPFGLRMEDFSGYALDQFGRRLGRLERARSQSRDELDATALEGEEAV
jgi:ribonucleoside-diphosphate reductase beta chain